MHHREHPSCFPTFTSGISDTVPNRCLTSTNQEIVERTSYPSHPIVWSARFVGTGRRAEPCMVCQKLPTIMITLATQHENDLTSRSMISFPANRQLGDCVLHSRFATNDVDEIQNAVLLGICFAIHGMRSNVFSLP